ncbi:MAG: hypothetical protein MRERC_14c015 [Mycoplasmataceae bacterium RC_NB112A]|nr:MAG: hypothetical protein MRERC_14c015 [Mycoplasmataceae bacterium RC_NB112A]
MNWKNSPLISKPRSAFFSFSALKSVFFKLKIN